MPVYSGGQLPLDYTPATWEIWLQRYDGTQLLALSPLALDWKIFIGLNGLNSFTLALDLRQLNALGYRDIPLDSMIEFRRRRGAVRTFSFYKRDFRRERDLYTCSGFGLNWLLQGRNTAAYYAGTSYTVKTGEIDNIMKEIVRENCYTSAVDRDTAAADTLRDYSQVIGFSVAANTQQAGDATIHCAQDNVYNILVKLANMSAQQGIRLFFEVFRTGDTTFVFDTRAVCYGLDRRGVKTFGRENGTMRDTVLEYKRSSEITYLYVTGQGEGQLRNIAEVSNSDTLEASPLNRREGSYNANQTAAADLTNVGYQQLDKNKPVKLFDGELLDTENARYGLDWDLGDMLDAQDGDDEFEIMITGVEFSMSGGGKEQIRGTFEVIS